MYRTGGAALPDVGLAWMSRRRPISTVTASPIFFGSTTAARRRSGPWTAPTSPAAEEFPTQGWWRCGSFWPAVWVARLTFLNWLPALFSCCIFSRHQTSTLRSLSKRVCRSGKASQRKAIPWFESSMLIELGGVFRRSVPTGELATYTRPTKAREPDERGQLVLADQGSPKLWRQTMWLLSPNVK